MSNSRRDFLRGSAATLAAGAALTQLSGCNAESPDLRDTRNRVTNPEVPLENPFKHSLASGDPTQSSAIIWSRITQLDVDTEALILDDVSVEWEVFSDPELTQMVASGTEDAILDHDFCVKADVTGLMPYTAYYYRFTALGYTSPIGRFQTLPDWDADTDQRFRVAIVSCSNHPHGYFHVYNEIAQRNDIDLVIHLGDYLYEYGDGEYGDTRPTDPPHEMISLDDYRRRHAQYKTDPDLAELHRQYAFINIWDDHETTDNSRKCTANNHTEADTEGLEPGDAGFNEGYWYERKTFGIRAYFEWMPIRPVEGDRNGDDLYSVQIGKSWRKFSAGNFADFIMIDTRLWGRDDQASGAAFTKDSVRDYQSTDPDCGDTTVHRDILGPDQEQWLHQQLQQSTAKWKVIGNQLIMSHLRVTQGSPAVPAIGGLDAIPAVPPTYLNTDAWDGYPTSQERLYEVLQGNDQDGGELIDQDPVDNVVVITGDIHTSWAFDITPDPDELPSYNAIGVEFVGPSVSSPGIPIPSEAANAISGSNTHLKYTNLEQRGWVLMDLAPDFCTGEWYHIGGDEAVDTDVRPAPSTLARVYRTSSASGENGLELNAPDITGADKQTAPSDDYIAARPAMAPASE